MVIHDLELKNFRNYSHLHSEFSPTLNLIEGKNGQGKTNLMEALFFISNLESFRTRSYSHLLQNQTEIALLKASIFKNHVQSSIQIGLSKQNKRVNLNHSLVQKTSEYIASFFSLVFTPEDVSLFRSSPQRRRKFFDRTISFINPSYFAHLQKCKEILAQKNKLLKNKDGEQLLIWNEMLSAVSFEIVNKRKKFVHEVNQYLSNTFSQMTGREEDELSLSYEAFIEESNEEMTKERILEKLQKNRQRELHYGHTLIGPHRDDYQLFMNHLPDREFFSQGELRVTNLSLKMSINQLLSLQYQFFPVVLLDDLFSELDQEVNQKVLKYFLELQNQVFITSTEIPADFPTEGKTIHIENGTLF